MNFTWLTEELMIQGIVVSDLDTSTKQARRRRRQQRHLSVKKREVAAAVRSAKSLDAGVVTAYERDREEVLQRYLGGEQALESIVTELRGHLKQTLNQSHDFNQLVRQIRGHIVAILEERFPGVPPEEAAEQLPSEGAIFFSTELMLAKLDATLFLTEPNRAFGDERRFVLHGLVTKYFRIYRAQATQKDVNLRTLGESYGVVRYNPAAIGAVIHPLLDNCVKYAPSGSKADILFVESETEISLSFSSLGPQILPSEKARIFTPGFRSAAARARESSGLGFGLAAARRVSDMLELQLSVSQEREVSRQFPGHYETQFTVRFVRAREGV